MEAGAERRTHRMTILPDAAPAVVPAPSPAVADILVHDTLAAGNRLWLRGRLTLAPVAPVAPPRSWWRRWRRVPLPPTPTYQVQVQTQVAGETLRATVPLRPDGTFEVGFEALLPPARRGWRVARNQISLGGET